MKKFNITARSIETNAIETLTIEAKNKAKALASIKENGYKACYKGKNPIISEIAEDEVAEPITETENLMTIEEVIATICEMGRAALAAEAETAAATRSQECACMPEPVGAE